LRGSIRELVPFFEKNGFYWSGDYKRRPDGMHFDVSRLGLPTSGDTARSVEVFVNGVQQVVPALFIADAEFGSGKTWVGVRALTGLLGGEIFSAGGTPFTSVLRAKGQDKRIEGRKVGGIGYYVPFGDVIALYRLPYQINNRILRLDIDVGVDLRVRSDQ